MWPRVLALGTVQAVFVINTRLASNLAAGSLSALNYAWVLVQIPQTLLGTAVGTVAFPTLSEQAALGRRDDFLHTADGALRLLAASTIPAAVCMWILGPAIISALLETGRFDSSAAQTTRAALDMFSLGLCGHVFLEVVARTFYARQDTRTPLVMACCAMVLNVALAVALVGRMGHPGLALANSVAVTAEVALGVWFSARAGYRFDLPRDLAVSVRAVTASAVMALAMVSVLRLMPVPDGPAWAMGLVRTAAGATAGAAAFCLAATVVGLDEVGQGLRLAIRAVTPEQRRPSVRNV